MNWLAFIAGWFALGLLFAALLCVRSLFRDGLGEQPVDPADTSDLANDTRALGVSSVRGGADTFHDTELRP